MLGTSKISHIISIMNSISDLLNHGLRLSKMRSVLKNSVYSPSRLTSACCLFGSQPVSAHESNVDEEEFRVLDLKQTRSRPFVRRKVWKSEVLPPRTTKMQVDQSWPNVWPGPRTFQPAAVPLPVRQGYTKDGAPPGKFANAELMKIPNFLHLTPPAIKLQCQALKKFCTAWPAELDTDEKCRKIFPLEVISSDYCHSSPDIKHPLARIVTIKVKLSSLPLDTHAKDKILRLVGERYDSTTDEIIIATDRCPVRKQNYDYSLYILTALFHEAWKVELWESEKSEADMEYYDWDKSISAKSVNQWAAWSKTGQVQDASGPLSQFQEYKDAVSELFNSGDNQYATTKYKDAVKKLVLLQEEIAAVN